MRTDFVVIASDDNATYLDFLDIVTKQWNEKIKIPVIFFHITTEDSEIEKTSYGFRKKFKAIANIPSGFQSQIVRFFAYKLFPESNILISDIDMLPLSPFYFNQKRYQGNDKILIYTNNAYLNVPYYPMCYVLSNGKIFSDILKIESNFTDFTNRLFTIYGGAWNTDEHYMFDCFSKNENILLKYNRNIRETRICRSEWKYNQEKLKNGEYIDSHLPRPYYENIEKINKIIT